MRVSTGIIASGLLVIAGAAGAQTTTYSNAYPGSYPNNGYQNGNRGDQGARYDSRQTIECSSNDQRRTRCRVPWQDARMVQQLSSSACVRGRTWGFDRGSIWVDRGCRARFASAGGGGGGWRPGPDWNRQIRLSCDSHGYNYSMCQVDVGRRGDVRLMRQTSSSACVRGRSWGWNRAGVWVDKGCSGDFVVDRRW
ncbi:MAG: DUF3011 domain-containing protein [Rhodanobacteraceae bacterium]